MPVTAVQVQTSDTSLFTAKTGTLGGQVTIQNLGPNPIYIQFGGGPATTAGGLQIAANGGFYTTTGFEDIHAIAATANQSSPADTRVSLERLKN